MANVLIVDDKEANLFTLEKVLKRLDVGVVKAQTGEEALRAALSHDFALAILDVQMPVMDGYELATLLRSDERMRNIPIIFLSAVYSDEPHVFKGYESGGVDFITKPFDSEILLSKVRVFLDLEGQRAELAGQKARLEALVFQLNDQIETCKRIDAQRQRAEEELRKAHNELEQRVEERTADLMRANDALKSINQELQDFVFVASHDLREPLRKIQVFSDRLKTRFSSSLDESGQDYLSRMESTANRMETLLDALLGYSRVTARSASFEPVNLTAIAHEVVSDLDVLVEKKKGKVEVGSLPVVEADPTQMRLLLQNLISNALKFNSHSSPKVKIYSGECEQERCLIFVEDNGIGFDERYLDRIFKPFQRLHGKESAYNGTGMGLAICRKIVERHKGAITARSVPGKGATFIVTLPLKQLS